MTLTDIAVLLSLNLALIVAVMLALWLVCVLLRELWLRVAALRRARRRGLQPAAA